MCDDKFSSAGRDFLSQAARNFSARDQAVARLNEIFDLCRKGIADFYAAAGLGKPDVYVDMRGDYQICIEYGLRPDRSGKSVLSGPIAFVFVNPEGKTFRASHLSWRERGALGGDLTVVPVNNENWKESISDWLIAMIKQSEKS